MKIGELSKILKDVRTKQFSSAEITKIYKQSERTLDIIEGVYGEKSFLFVHLLPYLRAIRSLLVLCYNKKDYIIQSQTDFGDLINKIILDTGIQKQEIAETLSISRPTLNIINSNTKSCNITLFLGLCDLFKLDIKIAEESQFPSIDNTIAAQITIDNILINKCDLILITNKTPFIFRTVEELLNHSSKF